MAHDPKYGTVTTTLKDIPEDEPVFIIRGQDKLAPAALAAYIKLSLMQGTPRSHIDSALEARELIVEFQSRNAARVKVPD